MSEQGAASRVLLLTARLAELPAEFAHEARPLVHEASRLRAQAVHLRAVALVAEARYSAASAALDSALYEAEAWGLELVGGEAESALSAAAEADAADVKAKQAEQHASGVEEAAHAALTRAERVVRRQRLELVPRRRPAQQVQAVEAAPAPPFRARPVPPGTRELRLESVLACERSSGARQGSSAKEERPRPRWVS